MTQPQLELTINPETYVLVKERARAKLEFDGQYVRWLFLQELESKARLCDLNHVKASNSAV